MQTRRGLLYALVAGPLVANSQSGPPIRPMDYRLDLSANYALTSYRLTLKVAPADLIRVFGPPILIDGDSESLGTYVFVGQEGEALTVYYRANDVDEGELKRLRSDFWRSTEIYPFSVGARAHAHATQFLGWVLNQLRAR
jgi:hypothetical protein